MVVARQSLAQVSRLRRSVGAVRGMADSARQPMGTPAAREVEVREAPAWPVRAALLPARTQMLVAPDLPEETNEEEEAVERQQWALRAPLPATVEKARRWLLLTLTLPPQTCHYSRV